MFNYMANNRQLFTFREQNKNEIKTPTIERARAWYRQPERAEQKTQ